MIGSKIKELRTFVDLTLQQLANELNEIYSLNTNVSMISSWENSRYKPSLKYLVAYADYFDTSVEILTDDNISTSEMIEEIHSRLAKTLHRKRSNDGLSEDEEEEMINFDMQYKMYLSFLKNKNLIKYTKPRVKENIEKLNSKHLWFIHEQIIDYLELQGIYNKDDDNSKDKD